MNLSEIVDGLSAASFRTLALALREPSRLRAYVAYCLKHYDELAGKGLPSRGPVTPVSGDTITLPAAHTGGGMSFAELVTLARVTKTRRPRTIFEMGSYDGLTTAVFLLNAPGDAQIYSLDLPPQSNADDNELATDKDLVAARQVGAIPKSLGLEKYTQLFCDSMQFDPAPFRGSIELGLVDAAHDVKHASNDTIKMAEMLTDDGIVFWHDYGGKGSMRPLASYHCPHPLYRIPETTLAWAFAKDLKRAIL